MFLAALTAVITSVFKKLYNAVEFKKKNIVKQSKSVIDLEQLQNMDMEIVTKLLSQTTPLETNQKER